MLKDSEAQLGSFERKEYERLQPIKVDDGGEALIHRHCLRCEKAFCAQGPYQRLCYTCRKA
jgi:hypothetical protein